MSLSNVIQSYKKSYSTKSHYDAIMIGSGLGSLTTAVMLAKEGQRVLVLERHYVAGGFTHVFKRRGYEWDVGIHYIGEVQRPNSIIKKLFDYVTDSKLKWADMGDVYDRIVIGDNIYDFVKGTQQFKQRLIDYFPEEAKAIEDYVNLVFEVNKSARNFYLEKVIPPLVSKISGGLMRKSYLKHAKRTTDNINQRRSFRSFD